ncbi:MAG: ABC-2 transporter permease [Clostridiales bacterium]|nr:ABC-2 transporter permease [Clostridiales bacterium]
MTAVFKKEIRTYFNTLTGYVFLGFFVAITGIYFLINNMSTGDLNYASTLAGSLMLFWILIPILTMRLFAEEARQKTDQLLLTSPVGVWGIVLGKFLAAGVLFIFGVIITAIFPFILSRFGTIAIAETVNVMFGYVLLGLALIAVGIYISSLTDNQIVAAAATFAALFVLFMIDSFTAEMPITAASSLVFAFLLVILAAAVLYSSVKNLWASLVFAIILGFGVFVVYRIDPSLFDGLISKFFGWFSMIERFENFYSGVFSLADTVYYLSFAFVFIYLTVNRVEKRRWA